MNYPITSIEMLSVLSNTQVLTAHLVGLLIGPLPAAGAPGPGHGQRPTTATGGAGTH